MIIAFVLEHPPASSGAECPIPPPGSIYHHSGSLISHMHQLEHVQWVLQLLHALSTQPYQKFCLAFSPGCALLVILFEKRQQGPTPYEHCLMKHGTIMQFGFNVAIAVQCK